MSETSIPATNSQQYVDLLVRTAFSGEALDQLLAGLPMCTAALVPDTATNPSGYKQAGDGCFVVRVFEGAEVFRYAIEQLGWGQVVGEYHQVDPREAKAPQDQVQWVALQPGCGDTLAFTLDAHSLSQALTSILAQEKASGKRHLLQIMAQAVPDGVSVEFTRFAVSVVAAGEDAISTMQAAPEPAAGEEQEETRDATPGA